MESMTPFFDVTSLGSAEIAEAEELHGVLWRAWSRMCDLVPIIKNFNGPKKNTKRFTHLAQTFHVWYTMLTYIYHEKTNHWFKYIYIYIPSPLGHQYTQEHPHCVGGETLICLGDSNPDFIFIWNQKLWRYYWWKNKWNYFSVLEHYDDILCMKQFQLKKTCSNRYHFGSTSLIFFSKPLTTRPRWPSLMTNTMTADPRTQWCGVCRSMFFWCGLMNRKQQKTGGFFQVWRWNEVYEQGIDFCWEIFVCKFNTCSWRLQVRRFGTGWTMHFDEDVVSTMGTNTLRYPRPSPINSAKMVFLHIIHINGRGGYLNKYYIDFRVFAWREVYINRKL